MVETVRNFNYSDDDDGCNGSDANREFLRQKHENEKETERQAGNQIFGFGAIREFASESE